MNKDEKQSLMSAIIVAGFALAVIWAYQSLSDGSGYPYASFLFSPADRFMDFFNFKDICFDPYVHTNIFRSCFPFLYVMSSELFLLPPNLAFCVFNFIFIVPLFALSWQFLKGGASTFGAFRDVLIFTCFNYPVLFCLDRGNNEAWQFVFLVGFFYAFTKKKYYIAAIVLGAAIAYKPFAVVFLILFVNERKILPTVFTCLVSVFLTCIGLILFGLGFSYNLHLWLGGLAEYQKEDAIGNLGLSFGHSLFGMLKCVYYLLWPHHTPEGVTRLSQFYFPFSAALGLAAWVYLVAFRDSLLVWEKWAILLFCMTALPFVSADYTLVHYLIPIYLFLNAPRATEWKDMAFTVLFALLMVPKSYFHRWPESADVSIGVVVNPLIQLAIVGIIVCQRRQFQWLPLRAVLATAVSATSAPVSVPASSKGNKKAKKKPVSSSPYNY